uniref:ATP synthase subunit a n=1 Tax=Dusuna sp. TaxID=3133678 RepID=A0AAU6PBZ3_9HEMI
MNLFTIFDPCTGFFSLNWLCIFSLFFLVPVPFWVCGSNLMMILNLIINFFVLEIFSLTKYLNSVLFMVGLFIYFMTLNLVGLVPYVYACSSHLCFSLGFSIPLWLSMMFFGWLMNFNFMFIHLVPLGTPFLLSPFMVMIETVSNFIRPISLAVRLSANMIAGHLLMSLLGSSTTGFFLMLFFIVFLMILLFEFAVSLIQSYVFVTLGVLYSSEI